MRVVSVNVGLPQEIHYRGEPILTGIFKHPAEGRVALRQLNFDGDRQADLRVHGGPDKAVYAYPSEHYGFWRSRLAVEELPPGSMGENLTLVGLTEDTVHIGDRYRIGTAELIVAQPRMPCYKLAAKFERPEIVKEMLESGFSGFYFAVLREGIVGAGDGVDLIARDAFDVRVADLNRLYAGKMSDVELMRRALQVDGLAAGWREMITDRLDRHVRS